MFIIAEAGVNHNGDIEIAKQLIDIAVDAKVDAIKFQTFVPDKLACLSAPMAEYQKENIGKVDSQLSMLKKLVLSKEAHFELINYCKKREIIFCSSPFDLESIDFLSSLNLPFWKIPSGEITNMPYLRKIGKFNEDTILSTGMSTLGEVDFALRVLTSSGLDSEKITLLQCNTDYPTKPEDVNLNCIETLRQAFKINVGYSDHTEGIHFPIAAVALGASVIEKHITVDKSMEGPDHKASLDPIELKSMVSAIREIEIGMGSFLKKPTITEYKNREIARKSIVASCDIHKGTRFSENNLTTKRPGSGISPMLWNQVIGISACRDFKKDECIELS